MLQPGRGCLAQGSWCWHRFACVLVGHGGRNLVQERYPMRCGNQESTWKDRENIDPRNMHHICLPVVPGQAGGGSFQSIKKNINL